jgi:hypothetical protein
VSLIVRRLQVVAVVVVVAIAALALAGCQSQRNKLIAGGISMGVSGVATYEFTTYDGNPPVLLTALAITAGVFGMAALLSGLDHEEEPRRTVTVHTPDRREEAWELTKLAAAAARSGNCDLVLVNDKIVRDIDAEFHEVVFMRDVAIQRCLADVTAGYRTDKPG